MKKLLLSLSAIAAFSGVRAQAIDIYNNTSCAVRVLARAYYDVHNPCIIAGGVFAVIPPFSSLLGQTSTNFAPPPAGYPPHLMYDGSAYIWGMAHISITNPSPGYEHSTEVGDNAPVCVSSLSLTTSWFNPTCGITQNITFVPGNLTTPATLTIN